MNLNEFYQLFVGIFSLLASILILMSLILLIWSTLRIREVFKRILRILAHLDSASNEMKDFISRNIDFVEMQKARLESNGLINTLLTFLFRKK